MKKIDKNVYKESRYGRDELFAFSIVIMIVALAMAIGGIVLIVRGCLVSGAVATTWRLILGILLAILGLLGGGFGLIMMFTAISMIKVVNGNVKDVGNSGKGIANALLCSKCGSQLDEKDEVCTNCGNPVNNMVKCPNCKTANSTTDKYCSKCGTPLKD